MEYISVVQYAEKYGISERTARNYCAEGKIDGAFRTGKTWNIPADAEFPKKGGGIISPLLNRLREEKGSGLRGGIYHRTQIDLTYNSNHIEGSRLTKEQTRFIFETNTLAITTENTSVDDIMETVNHFRCIDYVIDHATDKITEAHIKQLHAILKTNTSDSQKSWFAVGDYKRLPNEVGGEETVLPRDVHKRMKALTAEYNAIKKVTFDDILNFHVLFERIHPFQFDGGTVPRHCSRNGSGLWCTSRRGCRDDASQSYAVAIGCGQRRVWGASVRFLRCRVLCGDSLPPEGRKADRSD